jgi:hypothetical protein
VEGQSRRDLAEIETGGSPNVELGGTLSLDERSSVSLESNAVTPPAEVATATASASTCTLRRRQRRAWSIPTACGGVNFIGRKPDR